MRVILFVVMVLSSLNMANAAGLTAEGKIYFLNIGDVIMVRIADENGNQIQTNKDGCTHVDSYVLIRSESGGVNESFESIEKGLLLGRSLNARVRLYLNGCYTNGVGKERPVIGSVIINE